MFPEVTVTSIQKIFVFRVNFIRLQWLTKLFKHWYMEKLLCTYDTFWNSIIPKDDCHDYIVCVLFYCMVNYSTNLKIYLYRSHKIFIANLLLVKIQHTGWNMVPLNIVRINMMNHGYLNILLIRAIHILVSMLWDIES